MKSEIRICDSFWTERREMVRTKMIPYQWAVLNDEAVITIERERDDNTIPNEKSHAIANFKIAAGVSEGSHYGWVFQDSDVYKWLEAVSGSLKEKEDPTLQALADSVVDLIGQAQEEDGYLGTYFTIKEPNRKFRRLQQSHELYCAGHFLEAAAAYYEAVGSEKVLRIAEKLADCIEANFGTGAGQIRGYDGHEEVEIGLMKMYHLTGSEKYLELSRFFLYERGRDTGFFDKQKKEDPGSEPLIKGMDRWSLSYYQVHQPLIEQKTAEGHAVRLVYMCTAMADAAAASKDQKLFDACNAIWRNIVDRRMYITGGIGSTVSGEAFTFDYDLPNDTMYCETCASVGLVFFAYRMLQNSRRAEYADVMERALYNTVLSGMSLDGTHFFYVNPLEVDPKAAKADPGKSHVKTVRPEWLGCACCPPNLARLLTSLEQYICTQNGNEVCVNLFIGSEGHFQIDGGELRIVQTTEYPKNGVVHFSIDQSGDTEVKAGFRIPEWAHKWSIQCSNESLISSEKDGYVYLEGVFRNVELTLDIDLQIDVYEANPRVRSDVQKAAVIRGPFVYCIEGADNGENLHLLSIDPEVPLVYSFEENLLGGIGTITANGFRDQLWEEDRLYRKRTKRKKIPAELKMIPYYAWANRGENEMSVWIRMSSTD